MSITVPLRIITGSVQKSNQNGSPHSYLRCLRFPARMCETEGQVWMVKIKTNAYMNRLKDAFAERWESSGISKVGQSRFLKLHCIETCSKIRENSDALQSRRGLNSHEFRYENTSVQLQKWRFAYHRLLSGILRRRSSNRDRSSTRRKKVWVGSIVASTVKVDASVDRQVRV